MVDLSDNTVRVVLTVAASSASLLALTALLREHRRQRRLRTPPSVGSYPLIGSHLHLKEPWYRDIYERFGNEPIVMIQQGLEPVYMLNNWTAFKEAMIENADELSGRVSQQGVEMLFGDVGGIVASDGELWREYRRFTLRVLRDFGFGRKGSEMMIKEEAEHLCARIDASEGVSMDTKKLFSEATSNIICQLVFGSRLASEDPEFDKLLELFGSLTNNENTNIMNSIFLSILPFIERIPSIMSLLMKDEGSKKMIEDQQHLLNYCMRHKEKHEAELSNSDTARDYIDAHLMHQRQHPQLFNDIRLTLAVSDLFVAGTDTTSNTLRWAVLLMIDHPAIAEKVRREIHDKVGKERPLNLSDRLQLPYVMATIEEVLRKSSLVAQGIIHRVTAPITVAGYQLPKNAICAFNVYSIQHDPAYFPNPMQFRPERHIGSDGQFVSCEQLAAFGNGRRACLGESLARSELFLFFATIMQRYRFQLDPNETRSVWNLTEDPNLFKGAAIRSPPDHNILFSRI